MKQNSVCIVGEMEKELELCDVLCQLGLLVVEGRQPELSPRGRMEGPHCPTKFKQPHKCTQNNNLCKKKGLIEKEILSLWKNKVPVCIEVLMLPTCEHGTMLSEQSDMSINFLKGRCLLLEQWKIQEVHKRPSDNVVTIHSLFQAVKSYLYFSQLSSWLNESCGNLPANIAYRVCPPGDFCTSSFHTTPELHHFPLSSKDRDSYLGLYVTVSTLPRQSVPAVPCPSHTQPRQEQGDSNAEKPPEASEESSVNLSEVRKRRQRSISYCADSDYNISEKQLVISTAAGTAIVPSNSQPCASGSIQDLENSQSKDLVETNQQLDDCSGIFTGFKNGHYPNSSSVAVIPKQEDAIFSSSTADSENGHSGQFNFPSKDVYSGDASSSHITHQIDSLFASDTLTQSISATKPDAFAKQSETSDPINLPPENQVSFTTQLPGSFRTLTSSFQGNHEEDEEGVVFYAGSSLSEEDTNESLSLSFRSAATNYGNNKDSNDNDVFRPTTTPQQQLEFNNITKRPSRSRSYQLASSCSPEYENGSSDGESTFAEIDHILSQALNANLSLEDGSMLPVYKGASGLLLSSGKSDNNNVSVEEQTTNGHAVNVASNSSNQTVCNLKKNDMIGNIAVVSSGHSPNTRRFVSKPDTLSLHSTVLPCAQSLKRTSPCDNDFTSDVRFDGSESIESPCKSSKLSGNRRSDPGTSEVSAMALVTPHRPKAPSLLKAILGKEVASKGQARQKEVVNTVSSVPTEGEKESFRRNLCRSAAAVFNRSTGLPLQSSPAPIKKKSRLSFDYDEDLVTVKGIKNSLSCVNLDEFENGQADDTERPKKKFYSTSAPASTNSLLGNFEESMLNGRLEPSGVVNGFQVEIGASGQFCPPHISLPLTAFFFDLSEDNAPSPYLGHVNLETVGKRGYHVPQKGTIQVTLFNPNKTVVKMFVVMYDLGDMPASCQTFIRQKMLYMPVKDSPSDVPDAPIYLRYLIHLRFASSKSKKIYVHSDIKIIFARDKFEFDSRIANYELRAFTEKPVNPTFSPKR